MDSDDAQDLQGLPQPSEEADDASKPDSLVFQDHQAKMAQYLAEWVPEYRKLSELRKKGWESREGDTFFKKQQNIAENADDKTEQFFFDLMKRIGQEVHSRTSAFKVRNCPRPDILNMGMAPGGFLATALGVNPESHALAFTLPISEGGHKALLPENPNVITRFLDVTMLAADLGVVDIPAEHVDAGNFLPAHFEPGQKFDLVMCDAQLARKQPRTNYPGNFRDARRLTLAQLALGLERLRKGGTMVVLLNKVESWDRCTVPVLQRFSAFSTVRLCKPRNGHAKKSSFYMVAKDIDSEGSEAVLAVKEWKDLWRLATFGTTQEYFDGILANEPPVAEVLEKFGPELISLGRSVWNIQAKALAKAPFIKGR